MKYTNKILWVLLLLCSIIYGQQQNFLSVSGNKLIDSRGQEVRLTGLNWFGFETSVYTVHGIWTRDTKSVLQQIKDLGFNTIRIPWCNEMLNPEASITIPSYGSDAYTGVSPMNEEESKLTKPIELLDVIVKWCQENDLKIILDNHSRAADGYLVEGLWYTDAYPEQRWINDWKFMADRYKNYSAVVGMDLNNEPHSATWGANNVATDWNKAAERCGNAILEINPNVLIIVEGVGEFQGDSYWWGGQLKGAAQYPVILSDPSKLMYSAHEYGPEVAQQDWFTASDFPDNMPGIWQENFHYLYENETSPIFVGEFGIKDQDAFDGVAYTWFTEWMDFMGGIYSWTFWTLNPNSGDTGGILKDDWSSVNEWKMEVIRPNFAPFIPNVIGDGGDNNPPVADFTATPTSGSTPLIVQVDASGSSDPDGDSIRYLWDFGDGDTAIGLTSNHTYDTAGTFTIRLTVTDTEGNTDTLSKNITATGTGGGNDCTFGVPLNTALPTIGNSSYTNVYVFGNGPDLSSITNFVINWDLPNNGLYQLSMNTNNGQPSWWVNLLQSITNQNFNSSAPSITLSGTGIPLLDGSYNVTLDGNNFVMVSTSGDFTIYFSNDSASPDCSNRSSKTKLTNQQSTVSLFPNPVNGRFVIESNKDLANSTIYIYNILGKKVMSKSYMISGKSLEVDISSLTNGIYFVKIKNDKISRTLKIEKL